MRIARDNLNPYAVALEDAQEKILQAVKAQYLHGITARPLIIRIIEEATKGIVIEDLRKSARVSLWDYANRQKRAFDSLPPPALLAALAAFAFGGYKYTRQTQNAIQSALNASQNAPQGPSTPWQPHTEAMGIPAARYYTDLWRQQIKPTLDKLVKNIALDPNDYTGRNSLRNFAEMEVRYQDHLDNIRELKYAGVKVVQCSSHADCSKRCAPWQQQRYYSLDGTYGEIDGHKYIPLEVATDVWYVTKAGKRYKNGLLGFNCRHHLEEYDGSLPQTVSEKERKKQYDITKKQREMERAVRRKRIEAQTLRGINGEWSARARGEAKKLYEEYKQFSAKNGRAYYPMRVRF